MGTAATLCRQVFGTCFNSILQHTCNALHGVDINFVPLVRADHRLSFLRSERFAEGCAGLQSFCGGRCRRLVVLEVFDLAREDMERRRLEYDLARRRSM